MASSHKQLLVSALVIMYLAQKGNAAALNLQPLNSQTLNRQLAADSQTFGSQQAGTNSVPSVFDSSWITKMLTQSGWWKPGVSY